MICMTPLARNMTPISRPRVTAATIGLISMATPPTSTTRPMIICQMKPPQERMLHA